MEKLVLWVCCFKCIKSNKEFTFCLSWGECANFFVWFQYFVLEKCGRAEMTAAAAASGTLAWKHKNPVAWKNSIKLWSLLSIHRPWLWLCPEYLITLLSMGAGVPGGYLDNVNIIGILFYVSHSFWCALHRFVPWEDATVRMTSVKKKMNLCSLHFLQANRSKHKTN